MHDNGDDNDYGAGDGDGDDGDDDAVGFRRQQKLIIEPLATDRRRKC